MSIYDSRDDRKETRGQRVSFPAGLPASTPTGVPPVISSLSSGTPNATDATITWTTDLLSNSVVYWGTTANYLGASSPIEDQTLVTSHSKQITGLVTATLYHYRVSSRSATGGYVLSADGTFTTA